MYEKILSVCLIITEQGQINKILCFFYSPFYSIIITVHCLFQTRLQAGKGYKNTLHCVLTIYRKETVNRQTY